MTSLPLYSGENIIKQAAGAAIKDRKYTIYLTNRRLILEGGGAILEFPLEQVRGAAPVQGTDGQPGIRIAVCLRSGEIRDLVLTFLQGLAPRTGERDDWVSAFGGNIQVERVKQPRPAPVRQAAPVERTVTGTGLKFCPSCGSGLPSSQVKFCPSCGNPLPGREGAAPQVSPNQQGSPNWQVPPVQPQAQQAPRQQQPGYPPAPPVRPNSYDPLQPQPGSQSPVQGGVAPPPFPDRAPPTRKQHKKKARPAKLPVRKPTKQKSLKKAKTKRRDSHYGSHYSSGGIDPLYADASTLGSKIMGFVLHPRATFSACRYDSAGDAFRFFLFMNLIFSVATVAWIFLLAGNAEAALFPRLAEIYNGGAESFIVTVIEMFVYGLVSVCVAGIMLHFALILSTGGSEPDETFRTVFYAGTSYGIAALIPVAGIIIGPLWLLLLETVGVSESHNIPTGSAAIPVIISVVLIAVVFYVLHILEIFTFGLMRIVI